MYLVRTNPEPNVEPFSSNAPCLRMKTGRRGSAYVAFLSEELATEFCVMWSIPTPYHIEHVDVALSNESGFNPRLTEAVVFANSEMLSVHRRAPSEFPIRDHLVSLWNQILRPLRKTVDAGSAVEVESEIQDLGYQYLSKEFIPDEVTFEILRLLKEPGMFSSETAAHLLNFFEFESQKLSNRAKARCFAFLREWGDHFSHVHSQQVVAELQSGEYLKVASGA